MTYAVCKGGRTLIVAPACNTIDPWVQQLAEYYPHKSVFLCKTVKHIFKYAGEDFLIVSFESLPKTKDEIKKWKFNNLIMDESDSAKSK